MSLFDNNTDDITQGIESTIWKSIEKSITNDNQDTFNTLNKFVIKVLVLSIQNKSIAHFKKYIIFPASYYQLSFTKAEENIKFEKLHKNLSEISALHLKEIISFYLTYNEADIDQKKYENIEITNLFLYNGFNGFNRLLYLIISKGDISKFDYVINEYFLIDQLRYNSFHELKSEIRYYFKNQSPKELEQKKELFKHVKYFDEYKRHVIIGLRYWAIFLYSIKKNDLEVTNKYLASLRVSSDFQEMLKDIIYLRNHPKFDYFEWGSWDYKERPNGHSYSPPNPRFWLTFGFLIDLIKVKEVYLSSEYLSTKEMSEISYFYDAIEENTKSILNNFPFWQPIINVDTVEELERRISIILLSLKNLKRQSINATDIEIAEEQLSLEKINDFKTIIGNAWNNFSMIRKLFKKYNNIEIAEADIKFIGQKTFFEKAKKMFIDVNYQQIYNVGEIGGQTSRWIDEDFFDDVLSNTKNYIVGDNIIDTINKCLEYLENNKITATTIFVSSEYSYKEDGILNDKNFISKHNIHEIELDELSKYFIGTYNDLNVYTSYSDLILNKVIVCDFIKSFKMKYKTNADWFNNELKIEVYPIDDEEAERKYNLNQKKWLTRDNGIDLTKEEALVLIKNGVNIEVGSYNEFEIINPKAYAMGLIQNKIEE